MMIVIVLYVAWSSFITPAQSSLKASEQEIARLDEELRKAKATITRISNFEEKLAKASKKEDVMFDKQPMGSPLAWVPPRLENFFVRQGLSCMVQTNDSSTPLTGQSQHLQVYKWKLNFQSADFLKFGAGLASFETNHPLVGIQSIKISFQPENPANQSITVVANSIVRTSTNGQ